MSKPTYLNVTQAAKILGLQRRQTSELCDAGTLPAQRFGETGPWMIRPAAVERLRKKRAKAPKGPGRPPKDAT